MDVNALIDIAGVVVLISGSAAFAVAYFKSNYTKSTIQQLQDLSEALDKRVGALEEERTVLIEKIDKLEQENEVLRGLVTGESQFDALLRVIDKNHQEVMLILGASLPRRS